MIMLSQYAPEDVQGDWIFPLDLVFPLKTCSKDSTPHHSNQTLLSPLASFAPAAFIRP
jgi:hypothetical protein